MVLVFKWCAYLLPSIIPLLSQFVFLQLILSPIHFVTQTVDVEAHPPKAIISMSKTHYVFICRGKSISDFGTISFDTIDSHLRRGEPPLPGQICPITADDLCNYESSCESMDQEVVSIPLEELMTAGRVHDGSALEFLSLFMSLSTKGGELHPERRTKDVNVMVPLLATCGVVQRLLESDRREYAEKIAALNAEIEELRVARKGEER